MAKKNYYFTKETEDAIIKYNNSENEEEKNRIYREEIAYPFEKLAENIIHTFKFYHFKVPVETVKHDVVSFLITKIHKYKEDKGKAFSYFSVAAKNYLIYHNNKNYKKKKQKEDLEVLDIERDPDVDVRAKEAKKKAYEFVELMIEYYENNLTEIFNTKRDMKIAEAILELFRKRENIENFNKKALYILIREMSDEPTPYITKVVNKMKDHQERLHKEFVRTGDIDTDNINKVFLY